MKYKLDSLYIFLLAAVLGLACQTARAQTPNLSLRLNKYCGARIYNNDVSIPCYLLAGGYRASRFLGVFPYPATVIEFYPTPALPPLVYNGSVLNFTLGPEPVYQNYSGIPLSTLFNLTATPPALPGSITFPVPYCAATSFRVINGLSGIQYTALNPTTGSTVLRFSVPGASSECFESLMLYNYEPLCSAKTTQEFDTNCATDTTSFTTCATNPLKLTPVVPISLQNVNITAAGQVSANVVADLINGQILQTGQSACSGWGTTRNRALYGFPFPSTADLGLAASDLGPPVPYAGTITWIKKPGCTSSALAFRIDGIPRTDRLTPILIRSDANVNEAARVAYVPEIQCNQNALRPASGPRRQAYINVAPYCRIAGQFSTNVPAPPSTAFYPEKSGGVIPPANINDGNIVYMVSAHNLPDSLGSAPFSNADYPPLSAWTQISALYPTSVNQSRIVATVYPRNRFRSFVTLNQSFADLEDRALVYARKFSPYSDVELVASEARINNIPSCNCYVPQINSTVPFDSKGAIPCDTNYNAILNDIVPYYSQPTGTFSGTRPACNIKLLDGFLNTPNGVLQSGLYTARGFASGADLYAWRFSTGTPQSVVIVSGQGTPDITFRVFSSNQIQTLELIVTRLEPTQNFTSRCTLELRAFTGAPQIFVVPVSAQVAPGQGLTLNASLTFSPTGEPITFEWSVYLPDTQANVLTQTGNTPITTFTTTEVGTYGIRLRVRNPRVYSDQQITIVVTQNAPPPNTTIEIPSICQSFFNSGNVSNVTFPPYNATDPGFIPQPPQANSVLVPPIDLAPNLTPEQILDARFDNASEMFIALLRAFVGVILALGGIFTAFVVYWIAKRFVKLLCANMGDPKVE